MTTVEAAAGIGVSWPVGSRWFRHAGGMPPLSLDEPTGRYLSFAEREEIALLRAQDVGVREIARRIGPRPGDDLARASPQRGHPEREARLPRPGCAVEGPAGPRSARTAEARHATQVA